MLRDDQNLDSDQSKSDESINLYAIFFKYFVYWPWFVGIQTGSCKAVREDSCSFHVLPKSVVVETARLLPGQAQAHEGAQIVPVGETGPRRGLHLQGDPLVQCYFHIGIHCQSDS